MTNPITSGTVEQDSDASGSAENNQPGSTGSGVADPGSSDTSNPNGSAGGGGQATTNGEADDGGSQDSGGRGHSRSWKDDMKALRAERREYKQRVEQLEAQLRQFQSSNSGKPNTEAQRSEADFWSDPKGAIRAEVTPLVQGIIQELKQSQEQERIVNQVRQEQQEAIKFIRSQKGWTKQDEQELVEIIEDEGLDSLPPMKAAKYALALYKDRKGLNDKSDIKARAAMPGVGGAPGATGKKIWSKAEMDALVNDLTVRPIGPDGKPRLTPEIESEIRSAHLEGRVR